MPYKKKAPAKKRTKKAVGGALSAAQKRLLGQAQAGAVKKGAGAITKQIVNYTRKHGDQRKAAAAPAKRPNLGRIKVPAGTKAPLSRGTKGPAKRSGIAMSKTARQTLAQRAAAKRSSQSKARAGLGRAQKELLSQAQKFAIKRGKGTKAINNYTKKYGLTKAAKQAAMNKLRKRVGLKPRTTTGRPTTGSLKQRITSRSGTAAQRRARALAARRRAAMAARRKRPSRGRPVYTTMPVKRRRPAVGSGGSRMTPAQKRRAAMRRAPSRRRGPLSRAQNLAARRRAAVRRRAMAGARRRAAPSSRRGRPTSPARQQRFIGGLLKKFIAKGGVKRTNTNPMRAKLTGGRLKKRGILGKTRTGIGRKRRVGMAPRKSAYKSRGLFGRIKAMSKRTSGSRTGSGIFSRMRARSAPKPMTSPKVRAMTSPKARRAMTKPKDPYATTRRSDPYGRKTTRTRHRRSAGMKSYMNVMNKAMKM